MNARQRPQIVFLDTEYVRYNVDWPDFSKLGEVTAWEQSSQAEAPERVANADIVLANKVRIGKKELESARNLKFIGSLATGYNHIDVKTAAGMGIPVSNVPAYSTVSVVQHAIGLIIALSSQICVTAEGVARGEWIPSRQCCFLNKPPRELAGKTIGIVGFGDIGQGVARVANCLGMGVLAYNPRPKPAPEYSPFAFASLEEVWAKSDVVSLHCPLTPGNTGMADKKMFNLMKKDALFINSSRGGLVNEQDLADALNSGRIAGAGLDVLVEEPMNPATPLNGAKNCLITPHIAWASIEARTRLINIVYDNVKAFLDGKPINVVN